jgi:hypothetical protein
VIEPSCVPEKNASFDASKAPPRANSSISFIDPTYKIWEDTCDDGIDNDCDGLVDDDDPDCPFTPVKSTPRGLAWTEDEPIPNAASAAFLSLVYSKIADSARLTREQRTNLKCWSMNQVYYALGKGGRSFVVGMGAKSPKHVQHMESSCKADDTTCDWTSGYFAGTPNPRLDLVEGAIVAGPTLRDDFPDSRTSDTSRVGVHYNAPWAATLAGIVGEGLTSKTCGQLRGVYQDLFTPGTI